MHYQKVTFFGITQMLESRLLIFYELLQLYILGAKFPELFMYYLHF
jgi:hypothetical protein